MRDIKLQQIKKDFEDVANTLFLFRVSIRFDVDHTLVYYWIDFADDTVASGIVEKEYFFSHYKGTLIGQFNQIVTQKFMDNL
jgi:hypothetical protein